MFNSIYIAFLGTTISLLFCSMGGYAFAVYKFKGKNLLFGMLVGSMMIPPVLSLIPYFMIVKFLGLLDNHLSRLATVHHHAIWYFLDASARGGIDSERAVRSGEARWRG